jgi:hypothetical protein
VDSELQFTGPTARENEAEILAEANPFNGKPKLEVLVSGSPGYFGDLYILQGDVLTGDPPMVLRRAGDGTLLVS